MHLARRHRVLIEGAHPVGGRLHADRAALHDHQLVPHASSFADDDCPDPPRRFDVVREIVADFFVCRESDEDFGSFVDADASVQRGDGDPEDPETGDITGSGADCDTLATLSHDPDDLRDDSRSESLNPDPSTGLRVRRAWSIVVASESFSAPATAAAVVTVVRASKAPPDWGLSPSR